MACVEGVIEYREKEEAGGQGTDETTFFLLLPAFCHTLYTNSNHVTNHNSLKLLSALQCEQC